MNLVSALQQEDILTENGMVTNSSTLNDCLDFFFKAGALRASTDKEIIRVFSLAFNESPLEALKILFWSRDVREGAGERKLFRVCLKYLAETRAEYVKKNLDLIPEYGRWDDLLVLAGTPIQRHAFDYIGESLNSGDGLCAKWMPRKGPIAKSLRDHMRLSPKEYRKLLVNTTRVIESSMCSKNWGAINYSQVPSLAASRYQKAFIKNDIERYKEYISALTSTDPNKKVKINASAVYPYDVIKSLRKGIEEVANEQWKSLPNYLKDSDEMILPVVDVSGSMSASVNPKGSLTCIDVAISLGLYISERNEGAFKDSFITFSERPQLQKLKGSLLDRYNQLQNSDWGMSTDLESVFNTVLNQARLHKIDEKEMPKKILIISDMEFNEAINGERSASAMEMIRSKYEERGYQIPSVIFWNVQSRGNNFPVRFDETGTALISGFSPSIMTSILGDGKINPYSIMLDIINKKRYEGITI